MRVNSIQNFNSNRTSFKANEERTYKENAQKINDITSDFIRKDNIKNPAEMLFSLGLICAQTFVTGMLAAATIAALAPSAPGKAINALKKVSNELIGFSKKVIAEPTTNLQKATNFIKENVGKAEKFARGKYKTILCRGLEEVPENAKKFLDVKITDDMSKEAIAEIENAKTIINGVINKNNEKIFERIGGGVALAGLTPALLAKDEDDNGVKDVYQKRLYKRILNQSDKVQNFLSNTTTKAIAGSNLISHI